MKKSLLVLSMFFVATMLRAQDSSSAFTLKQCIDYGVENHIKVKNAYLDADGAESSIKETIGTGLPQINGQLDLIDNIGIQNQFLPANTFDPTQPADEVIPLAFGIQYMGNANISINQLIFNGTYFVGIKAARAYKDLMKKSILSSKIDVAKNISSAYYMVLVGQEQLDFLMTNKSTLDSLLRDTKIMYDNGIVEKLDVMRLEVSLNNVEIEISKVERMNDVSLKLLKFQMGMPGDQELQVTETLESLRGSINVSGAPSPSYESRIEYQLLQSQRALYELDKKRYQVMALPSVGAFASLGYNTGQIEAGELFKPGNWEGYSMIGLRVDVPIFSGFTRKHKITQAQVTLDKNDNDIKMLEMSIDFEVSQYHSELQNALNTLASHEKNVELAEEVYNTTKIKYKAGVGTNLEVVQAESSLKQSKINYNAAIYDALIAKMNLDKALGKLYTE